MTIRNWVKFFIRAMAIGGAITALVGLIVRWDFFYGYLQAGEIWQFSTAFLWMVFLGFTMSVIAQMGFFAYLTVHQFGINMFRTLTLWNWVQMLAIVVVLFDLVFFRFDLTKADSGRTMLYIFLLITLIGVSVVTAYFKAQWTKKYALISALFFMIVITTLEWLPALMIASGEKDDWVTIFLFPLLAVNAYQLLVLPKYNRQSDIDKEKLDQRREERRKVKKQSAKSKKN